MDSKISCCLCCVVKEGSIQIFSAEGTALDIAAILRKHYEVEVREINASSQSDWLNGMAAGGFKCEIH